MPTLTRWYVKTSLIYLVVALLVGALLASGPAAALLPPGLAPVYLHLLVVGWLTQLIFGVVLWMFPKFSREKPRGNQRLAWATYILLNLGLLLRALGEPLNAAQPDTVWGWLLVSSALLQWLAGLGFVANTWARVREK